MLKVKITLEAEIDMNLGWKKGQRITVTASVFDKPNGLAFNQLDNGWKIISMKMVEYKEIEENGKTL